MTETEGQELNDWIRNTERELQIALNQYLRRKGWVPVQLSDQVIRELFRASLRIVIKKREDEDNDTAGENPGLDSREEG